LTIEISLAVLPDDHPNREILALEQIGIDRNTETFLKVYGNRDGEFLGRVKSNSATEIGRNDGAPLKVNAGHEYNVRCWNVLDELSTIRGPDRNGLGLRRVKMGNLTKNGPVIKSVCIPFYTSINLRNI